MPAATSIKRKKGIRIERPFIIGSEAWPLDPSTRKSDTPPDHTKGWRIYVRVPDGQPAISTWLKKVTFKIFHTYENPSRVVENAPFEITETGWGGFNVDVRLFFVSEASAKPEWRSHYLQLEPYGGEELQAKQASTQMVRSDFLDFVEFNEPTDAFYELLTGDEQFDQGRRGRGKGKGKAKAAKIVSNGEGSVELPEKETPDNPFARSSEKQLLEMLASAEAKIDELLVEEKTKNEQTLEELGELRRSLGQVEGISL